jgi:glutathione S-transferase
MPKVTVTYFDFPGSRGEECRLALTLAGVEFFDERLKPAEFQARKSNTPFGALPVFTVEGHPPLAQSNAILTLIGREHGLLPSDPWEAARHHAVMDAVEDLRHTMGPITRIKDEAEKKAKREEAARGYLPEWAGNVEKQLEGPFVGGHTPSVADLKIFVVLGPYLKGAIDHVPATVFDGHPKLLAVHKAVAALPAVVAWYAKK